MPDAQNVAPVLVDFLNTVPHQLTAVLIHLAPHIARLRSAAETLSWKSSWYDSWLALAAFWSLSLLAETTIKYLLPVVALSLFLKIQRSSLTRPVPPPPVTEHTLQTIIADLTTIQSLIPVLPALPSASYSTLLRISATVYLPYLLLTHFVPLRIILALTSSIFIAWRAPWAVVLRTSLWRSAWLRWSLYYVWSHVSGQPLPPRTLSYQPTATTPKPVNSLRFLFTVYENQRWWMGLDWTAALLPGERPSWCSAAQHAVSPPNAFSLPAATTVYLPNGTNGRVKRTATWKWEEPEWKVLVRKEGSTASRIERPLPAGKDENPKKAPARKESTNYASSTIGEQTDSGNDADNSTEEDATTDGDGWVYGDNKWEGQNNKGGLGKYTRYRRWTRVAVVSEIVETVEDGEIGVERATISASSTTDASFKNAESEDSPLRQRLKTALLKGSV